MKATRILLLTILLGVTSVQAQKIYIRGGLGMAVSTAARYMADINNYKNGYTIKVKKQGFGTGLPFVLAAGYNFNEHFSIELGFDYFNGFLVKEKLGYTFPTFYTEEDQWRGQMLSIVPALVMALPLEKFKPYARLGLKLGILNRVIHQKHEVLSYDVKATVVNDVQSKTREYGGIAIGVQAAIGTDFALSNLISLFCEIQMDGISYSPTHGKYTEYIQNGVDEMGSRSVKLNEWVFKKEAISPNDIPDDQPNETARTNYQFGNIGLLLGVKIKL